MVIFCTLLLTTKRSSRFSTGGVGFGVAAFHVGRGGRLPSYRRHFSTWTISGTNAKNIRPWVSRLAASPDERKYQQQPKRKYLTAEDLAVNTNAARSDNQDGEDLYPQRAYVALSDFEEDVESMAANYVPGPEDFLDDDDLEGQDAYDNLLGTKPSVPEPRRPKGTPKNLSTGTKASKLNKGVDKSQQSSSTSRKTTTTTTTTTSTSTFFTATTASQVLSKISKGAPSGTFMVGIADPVLDDNPFDYSSEPPSSPAESFQKSRTFEAVVMSDTETTVSQTSGGEDWSLLSREEFRSKFLFEDQAALPLLTTSTPPDGESSRVEDELYSLKETVKNLEKEITTANNGSPINLSSYKQVSQALFGTPDESTSKDVLEAMAVSNTLAKLILEHRQTLQRFNKLKKKNENFQIQKNSAKTTTSSSAKTSSTEPLLLVDTSSLIFRAYYSMPPMHRADGVPVSAVLGFCNLLNKMVLNALLEGKQPRLVLCCDAPSPTSGGPKTWRHDLYRQYKANRQEAPMDLIPQFPYFRLAAQAYGMTWIEAPGYEADDVIASLAHKALAEGLTTHIYSGDKDLMQLITNSSNPDQGGNIEMVEPSTMTHWTHDSVIEKWGVPSHQLGDVLALAGDTADNIPGVPGIGPKIAAQLLQQFGSLEELFSNLDLVPQAKRREKLELYRDQALLSQQLVQLERNLDWSQMVIDFPDPAESSNELGVPDRVADLKMQVMNPERILRFYDQMGFVTIKERLIEQLQRRPKWQGAYAEAISSPTKRKSSKWQSKSNVEVPKPEDFDNIPF